MTDRPRRRADRFSDEPLENIESLPIEALRDMRAEGEELEAELSYVRRLIHGKVDIIRHELERRQAGGEGGFETLISKLPTILSDDRRGEGGRHMRVLVPRNVSDQRREVERIASASTLANLEEVSTEDLTDLVGKLTAAEAKISGDRRRVQESMDRIRAELVRRYREGQEDPSALLSS